MKRSNAKAYVSTDRVFYYSGDTIHVKLFINMQQANVNCTGVEMSLGRCIHADGHRVDK